ncbi:HAD-IIB family hydrolase [Streptomyces sp. NPDC003247]|uniref:HAD-IIB family hydrolase n=1 Tax=Streptomyces sp. NPDC003247 TaxID=3364677 RepID=UPI0036D2000E
MPPRTEGAPEATALPLPRPVRAVAFSDFDETYLAHSPTEGERACREALEDFLAEAGERHGLLFGWVTGSSLSSVLRKARAHGLRTLPHFVACSLGTELLLSDAGELRPDPGWQRLLPDADSLGRSAGTVLRELSEAGVGLEPQPGRAPDSLVKSYYYRSRDPEADARNLAAVRDAAARGALGVNVSRCNPAVGDPADCYDVDLLPRACGKRQIVRYVCRTYGIDPADAFAFGDSGNDLEMLAAVGHGVLVGNCTEEARGRHPRVSDRCHSDAVLTTLRAGLRAGR